MAAKKALPLSRVYQLLEPGPVVMITTSQNGKPNIMTMTWHMMVDFEPPLVALVMSDRNYSFAALKETKQCVINIPTADMAHVVVGVGNTTGARVDKFKKFKLTPVPATHVKPPLIDECFANLECNVVDFKMAKKYNIFIVKVVKAWIAKSKRRHRTLHHCGNGVFVVDGKVIKLKSHKK